MRWQGKLALSKGLVTLLNTTIDKQLFQADCRVLACIEEYFVANC